MLSIVLITFGVGVVLMAAYIFYLNNQKSVTNKDEKQVEKKLTEPSLEQQKKPSYGSTLQKGKRFKKVKTIQNGEKPKSKESPKQEDPSTEDKSEA